MYTTYSYYLKQYLCGTEPKITETEFAFYLKKAQKEIDYYTFNRLKENSEQLECVQECVCELIEMLYTSTKNINSMLEQGISGPMVSYANDGESGTFSNDTNSIVSQLNTSEGQRKEIKKIIYLHLNDTGLLYAGV